MPPPGVQPPIAPAPQPTAVLPTQATPASPPPGFVAPGIAPIKPIPLPDAAIYPDGTGGGNVVLPPMAVKKRRPIGWIITVSLLSLAVIGVGIFLYLTLQRLDEAKNLIEHQKDLIDKKDTFNSAMSDMLDEASGFDGVKVGELVPQDQMAVLAQRGYTNRWDSSSMDGVIKDVAKLKSELVNKLAAADKEKSTNKTKSAYEAVIDKLGGGFAYTAIDNADKLCKQDVLGCVTAADPYTVHIDKADTTQPFMTKLIQQGIAYHEFAHVLQYTHPTITDKYAAAFANDYEEMADCFALTYLKGWALHQTVFVSQYTYYEVDIGYGYTCNSAQKKSIKEWYESLGYRNPELSQ